LDAADPVLEPTGARNLSPLRGAITLERVSYSYGERRALVDLSLAIPVGKITALVGPSGGGKSTVISLLLGFDRPREGSIRFDGVDLAEATLDSARKNFALVTQEALLFTESVLENIRVGRPSASLQAVKEAAKIADADDFIRALPRGYETRIGERGVTLSGGQRQRICIARAILSEAPILLLDEATSSLDPSGEHEVQQALSAALPGRTALIIAHRLWTVAKADCIYVLEGGQVVERGTHTELLQAGGLYARLWTLQQDSPASRSRVA